MEDILAPANNNRLTDVSTLTRDQVVPFYRQLIEDDFKDNASSDEILRVNNLILSKWKTSGLLYIKNKAWAELELLHPTPISYALDGIKGHATFIGEPSPQLLAAVNELASRAFYLKSKNDHGFQ